MFKQVRSRKYVCYVYYIRFIWFYKHTCY